MNFLKEHNVFMKLLSLLIAIFLWSFVVLSENPLKTQSFANLPVEEIGVEALEDRNLIMVNTDKAKITLRVTGTSKDMASLSQSEITAQVDLSNIQQAGVYYIQPEITVPKQVDSISFNPSRLQITIENIISKEVPVQVTTMNTLGENQLLDTLTPSSQTITVTGAESIVETVDHALLTVDLENITKNKAQTCRVALYTELDELVDSELVKPESETLDVTVGLNQVKTVPLSVTLTPSETLTAQMVTLTISPETIRIYGSEEALKDVTGVLLGSINLADVKKDGEEHTFNIKLPEGVYLMEGEPKQARVKLTMKDGIKRTFTLTDFSLTDAAEPAAAVQIQTEQISIEAEGKAHVMSNISTSDFKVNIPINSEELGQGEHIVPCEITCDIDGVTILTEETTVSIMILATEEIEGS